ncbi:MAG TPA: hypothetical protein VGK67_17035 [Myxococcales bacterium]
MIPGSRLRSPDSRNSRAAFVVAAAAAALALAALAGLAACANDRRARAEPAPATPAALDAQAPDAAAAPAPPEKAVVPKGCDINLGGRYKLSKKPFWTYQVEDDGVHLVAKRADLPDAGEPAEPDRAPRPSEPGLVLERTARGFVGNELGFARSPSGTQCPVTFRAEIVACDAQGFTVRSEDSVALDDQCHIQRSGPASASEKVLVRQ